MPKSVGFVNSVGRAMAPPKNIAPGGAVGHDHQARHGLVSPSFGKHDLESTIQGFGKVLS